jgi:chromosome segregation ATPase
LIDPNASPGAVFQLRDQVEEARKEIASAQSTLYTSLDILKQAEAQKSQLESQSKAIQAIQATLPGIEASVNDSISKIDAMQPSIVSTEKAMTTMASSISDMDTKATVTSHLSFTKKEFVVGILDVCEACPMWDNIALIIKRILTELSTHYGGNGMPADLKQRVDDMMKKINQFKVPAF